MSKEDVPQLSYAMTWAAMKADLASGVTLMKVTQVVGIQILMVMDCAQEYMPIQVTGKPFLAMGAL